MSNQIFGPCRSRATTKPRQLHEDPVFYTCRNCGRVIYSFCGDYRNGHFNCCGSSMEQLPQNSKESLPPGYEIDYKIIGGFNNNAIRLSWFSVDPAFKPTWIFLKTFTGGQFKIFPDSKKSPAVFPLADEDAYSYCGEDPCLECVFCCKWGFSFFVYFDHYGLITLPIDRKQANWQSDPANKGITGTIA